MSKEVRTVLRLLPADQSPIETASQADLSIADVAAACGLPQPVIAQLVPRTWTDQGWMYTPSQLDTAVQIARTMRAPDRAGE